MNRELEARAAAGAAYMDVVNPGWWRKIRTRDLDMGDGASCVFGQLNGDYVKGRDAVELDDADAMRFGFLLDPDERFRYWWLTRVWRDQVRARRQAKKVGRR